MNNNQRGFGIVETLVILVIVLLLGGTGWYVWQKNSNKDDSTKHSSSSTAQTDTSDAKDTPKETEYGYIKGTASFPGSGLPSDEIVCAENVKDPTKLYCDKEVGARFAKQEKCAMGDFDCNKPAPDTSYTIKLPVGEYYVFSTAESRKPGYKAYYNEFVKCGLSAGCAESGHNKYIVVTVKAGETVSSIDPADWYAN